MSEVKPYDSGGDKKEQVEHMFDRIAPYYDVLNRLLSLGIDRKWRKKAIQQLRDKNPGSILDIATGTADLALEAYRQFPEAEIRGLDISSEMIRRGKDKVRARSISRIHLEVGDSEKMPYESNTFEAATVAFGVRNFGHLQGGLKEIYRVLEDDGQLIVLEFTKPRVFPFKQMFNLYFKYILPAIGRLGSRDRKAYRYLYESVQAFPDYELFAKELEKAGFKSLYFKPLSLGICCIYVAEK